MDKDGPALVATAALDLPCQHRVGHVIENLSRAKDRHMAAENMTVKAPDLVLGFRTAGEFPHRLLDEVQIGEILITDIGSARDISGAAGPYPFGMLGIAEFQGCYLLASPLVEAAE